MKDPSGVHGARTTLAIAFAIITALVALLWVIPKTPGGGFWLFTLPAAILFPFFSYAVIAPGTRERTTGVAWAMVSILVVLYLGGMLISSLAFGDRVLIGAAETMQSLTVKWRSLGIATLVIVGILKLVDSSSSKKTASAPATTPRPEPASVEPTPASARPSAPADGGIPAGSIPPSPLVPAQSMTQPARQQAVIRPTTVVRPAAMPAPAPLMRPAHTPPVSGPFPQVSALEQSSASEPAPAPHPVEKTATVSGASFVELTTLVEVATSLSEPSSATSLLLSATPTGLELAAAGTEIGIVAGTWNGAEPLRVRLSAHETLEALSSFSPSPETLSVRFRLGDETAVEVRDDRSVRRFALSAVPE
ncbi:hypothetical protein [Brachybacterium paraconglomeratum]|uniref:hypothetical protein n=1 Tax=Brachybacterium paraconglomeratum TaxID=173362 RepID=UPI003511D23A